MYLMASSYDRAGGSVHVFIYFFDGTQGVARAQHVLSTDFLQYFQRFSGVLHVKGTF
jgi:hypothetical protein